MKVVAFNGSARKDGNTAILLKIVLGVLEENGIETELIQLAGLNLSGCVACYKCFKEKNRRCAQKDDPINDYIAKMEEAHGILLGSPVYFADLTANMKALIERCGMVARANGDMFRRKVGASVVAVRRGGAVHTFDSLNHFFQIGQMIVVGSCYWNLGRGKNIGEVEKDEEGIKTMKILGENMAWVLKKLYG
ncbi:flavodoxin family protein [Thermodesulfatator atlanticus]|uniref:flavodoxin family protein n=1 Tax=Thermodesulfatator atlanticus TaxID=501497 RepID=UPI0003B3287A|nr:flavodoxin family protein [Thermodesulfatator atlanticus]